MSVLSINCDGKEAKVEIPVLLGHEFFTIGTYLFIIKILRVYGFKNGIEMMQIINDAFAESAVSAPAKAGHRNLRLTIKKKEG